MTNGRKTHNLCDKNNEFSSIQNRSARILVDDFVTNCDLFQRISIFVYACLCVISMNDSHSCIHPKIKSKMIINRYSPIFARITWFTAASVKLWKKKKILWALLFLFVCLKIKSTAWKLRFYVGWCKNTSKPTNMVWPFRTFIEKVKYEFYDTLQWKTQEKKINAIKSIYELYTHISLVWNLMWFLSILKWDQF